jgi:hypothetical protein
MERAQSLLNVHATMNQNGAVSGRLMMNKIEVKAFVTEDLGLSGLVPTVMLRDALLVSSATICRWVKEKKLVRRYANCFEVSAISDFLYQNPQVISKLKAKKYKQEQSEVKNEC